MNGRWAPEGVAAIYAALPEEMFLIETGPEAQGVPFGETQYSQPLFFVPHWKWERDGRPEFYKTRSVVDLW